MHALCSIKPNERTHIAPELSIKKTIIHNKREGYCISPDSINSNVTLEGQAKIFLCRCMENGLPPVDQIVRDPYGEVGLQSQRRLEASLIALFLCKI